MQIDEIIAQLDSETARLQQARSLLAATTYIQGPGSSKKVKIPQKNAGITVADGAAVVKKKRGISPDGIARIAAAQKKRWAKAKKAVK